MAYAALVATGVFLSSVWLSVDGTAFSLTVIIYQCKALFSRAAAWS